jgi:hypothetical protein
MSKKSFKKLKLIIFATGLILISVLAVGVVTLENIGRSEYRISRALGFNFEDEINKDLIKEDYGFSKFKTFVREIDQEGLNNTNQENQIKPLVADNDHDVVVLKECDLAIRYKKNSTLEYREYAGSYLLDIGKSYVNCDPGVSEIFQDSPISFNNSNDLGIELVTVRPRKEDYQIKSVQDIPGLNADSKKVLSESTMVYKKGENISFIGNKGFIINLSVDIETKDILEIQFDSLAPSEPSIKL